MKSFVLLLSAAAALAAKTLVVVTPHGDDFVLYAGGAIARLIDEGHAAVLVRVTNDEKHSVGISMEETRLRTRRETGAAAKILGFQEVIHLNFKDGELDALPETDLRIRFIQLFRTLKPDAVMTADPWTRYDDNFDHNKVGRAVEDACWTGGNDKFHPEMNRAGLAAFSVPQRYYWSAGQRYVNHVADVTAQLPRKRDAIAALTTFRAFRPARWKNAESVTEELHQTKGSGLQGPYVEWFAAQQKSGKPWGAPATEPVRAGVPDGKGRVLAIVSPHADDFTIMAGGTISLMIKSGWTAYLIRVTNDEKDSYNLSPAETITRNAAEVQVAAKILGIREVISLNFKNDELDPVSHSEVRGRLILLFRLLKPDALMSWDPWSLYEENPDHLRVARAAAEAAWAAGTEHYNREHFALDLKPHTVAERYYWSRGPADTNRIFDISPAADQRMRAVKAHKTMMRATALHLQDKLATAGLRIPFLDNPTDAAIRRAIDGMYRRTEERFHFAAEGR